MASVTQVQVRCGACHRRLADLVNEVRAGQALLEVKCPRCRQPHLEIIRAAFPSERADPKTKGQMDA